ncbi:MAG: hypothetical protein ACOCQ4_00650 [bacterium]
MTYNIKTNLIDYIIKRIDTIDRDMSISKEKKETLIKEYKNTLKEIQNTNNI